MKTNEKPEVKKALEAAEKHFGDQPRHWTSFWYLGKALVLAVCEGVDAIKDLTESLPNGDK